MSKVAHRILLLAAAMSLALPVAGFAQQSQDDQSQPQQQPEQGTHGRHAGRRGARMRGMQMLAKKLNLTDDQKQQFRKIHQDTVQQAKSIRSDSSLSNEQKRDKLQQLHKQAHQQMFAVLTPDQKDQLKQLREQRRKQMQEKKSDSSGQDNQASGKSGDDDPFAGMVSDDEDPPAGGM
jgi:Spy/CpxP family protein refolding chaperone